jgi:hypothetical protein
MMTDYDQRRAVSDVFNDAFRRLGIHPHPLVSKMCIVTSIKYITLNNGRIPGNKNGVTNSIIYVCSRFLDMSLSKDVLTNRDPETKINVNQLSMIFDDKSIFNVAVRSSVLNHLASMMVSRGTFDHPVLFSEYQSEFPKDAAACLRAVNQRFEGGNQIPSPDNTTYTMHERKIAGEVYVTIKGITRGGKRGRT